MVARERTRRPTHGPGPEAVRTDVPRGVARGAEESTGRAASSSARRVFLLVTAFVCGAAVMIIELAGNRVLAPWFGNSLYTWTGLIGVILMSISGGYYLGGYLADRKPDYVVLAHLLAASALLTLLTPILQRWLEGFISSADLIAGPVMASLALFAAPGCLLAAVSPFSIRLISLLSSDKHVGLSAGLIGMISTFGSVAGTFGAGFVLVPHLGLRMIFLATGGLLVLLAAVGYGLFARRSPKDSVMAAVMIILFLAGAGGLAALPGKRAPNTVYEKTTFYHRIRVADMETNNGKTLRYLNLDTTWEGGQYLESREIALDYQQYWRLAKLLCPQLKRAVFLGGGAFAMPEALLDAFPGAECDVVEIDPQVIEVGRMFYHVSEYPRLHPIAGDARRFLAMSGQKYDLIFGDAYNGVHFIPAHLVTQEYFQLVKNRLSDDGVYMMNVISAPEGGQSNVFHAFVRTLSSVFGRVDVFLLEPNHPTDQQNIILVAGARDLRVESLVDNKAEYGDKIANLLSHHLDPAHYDASQGILLTDDRNPIEYLVARALKAESR